MPLARRTALAGLGAVCATAAIGMETPDLGLGSLERLGKPGALNGAFIPPSRIDPAYSAVIYVSAALKGPGTRMMWIVRRDDV